MTFLWGEFCDLSHVVAVDPDLGHPSAACTAIARFSQAGQEVPDPFGFG